MRRLYLSSVLRAMTYYACSTWGNGEPDDYILQLVIDHQMVYSGKAHTDTELIDGAKKKGVTIHGQHWADYMVPSNGLEKRMRDDVQTLSNIVAKLVTVEALVGAGYSKADAKRILKDAKYISDSNDNN